MSFNYLVTFIQSNLLEIPFYMLLVKNWNWREAIPQITIMNAMTHTMVIFVFMRLPSPLLANIFLAEAFAFIVEAVIVQRLLSVSNQRALLASGIANLVSWQVGPWLNFWF